MFPSWMEAQNLHPCCGSVAEGRSVRWTRVEREVEGARTRDAFRAQSIWDDSAKLLCATGQGV